MVDGTVDQKSITVDQHGDIGYSFSNYADGSGTSGTGIISSPTPYGPLEGPANQAGLNILRTASGTVSPIAGVEMGLIGMIMPEMFAAEAGPLATGLGGLGRTAGQLLKNMSGKSRPAAREALGKAGFKQKGVTKAGYETWVHPDGSRVTIGPDGGVDRMPPRSVGDGFRYDPGTGNIRRPHNFPEEKVN